MEQPLSHLPEVDPAHFRRGLDARQYRGPVRPILTTTATADLPLSCDVKPQSLLRRTAVLSSVHATARMRLTSFREVGERILRGDPAPFPEGAEPKDPRVQ